MKVSNKKNHVLGDFILKFQPISISFTNSSFQSIKIYLEKNVQVIGQVQQIIKVNSSSSKFSYTFHEQSRSIQFRLLSTKYANYQISLYSITDDGRQEWVDSSSVNFSDFLKDYQQEFKRLEERLQIDMRQKVVEALPDLWRGISQKFSKNRLEKTAKFNTIAANLDFTLTPFSEYDQLVSLDDNQKYRQRQKDMKANFKRTATMPNFNPKQYISNKIPILKNQDSDMKQLNSINIQFSNNFNRQTRKFSQTIEDKKISKSDLKKINEQQEIDICLDKNNRPEYPQVGSLEVEALDIDQKLEQEELRGNDHMGPLPSWEKQVEKTSDPQSRKLYSSENLNNNQKQIMIGKFRQQKIPQTNSPSILGIVSLGSYDTQQSHTHQKIPQNSKFKQYSIILLGTVIFGLIIYFLMHPLSRTG